MAEIVIKVENLSKLYRIGIREAGYRTFRETLVDAAKAPLQRLRAYFNRQSSILNHQSEALWALKDVSFEVKQGEVVGIIGRNGAGKSTLLKILSKITEPTEGRVELRGRVGSLLEVGTGFHPELTGHENVYLYGAILGMTRWEITRKFDEIVAFAELEKFIDTPVKRYSSGMYMRLAFAVAAHLEPEILLVDEVLAVGDAAFQKKCLGKMGEVSKQGRTVLFVSHNLAAVASLCERAFLFDEGALATSDHTSLVLEEYVRRVSQITTLDLAKRTDRRGDGSLRFTKIVLFSGDQRVEVVGCGDALRFELHYESTRISLNKSLGVAISIYNHYGQHLLTCWNHLTGNELRVEGPNAIISCTIPRCPLAPGRYSFNLYCEVSGSLSDWVQEAGVLDVIEGDFFGTGKLTPQSHGGVLVHHEWQGGPA
ncbi:MAG: ABC transporter ATP-binding protein [Deltaproteobacteria bacterium]|nr:ABC transporter ATP-binding protein [Deltaproteobacteria bacterium]